jgi:hypothetical protein
VRRAAGLDQHAAVSVAAACPSSRRAHAPGAAALLVAIALLALPAVLALTDPAVLGLRQDGGWLGSPITRFATLQSLGMLAPLVLGVLAAARDRGRDYGTMAVLIAILGNFLVLRVLLALVVTPVLL